MSPIQKIIAGLQIFDKYHGDVSAEHDVIYATPNRGEEISEDDEAKLKELDWSYDSDIEAWYYFV